MRWTKALIVCYKKSIAELFSACLTELNTKAILFQPPKKFTSALVDLKLHGLTMETQAI
jgi:hypothetical protein